MAYEKDPAELGALWTKVNTRGEFMTGEIEINGEKIKIVCFPNAKKNDKSPDWRVLKSQPKAQTAAVATDVDADSIPF